MDSYDIIVIGGGSGGCSVAGGLAEDGDRTVCVIEAGGKNDGFAIRTPGMLVAAPKASNWNFDTEAMDGLGGRVGYQPRGRGLGGSSAINAMLYIRGNQWDYDNWADLGCTGWRYSDVLPWFKKGESNERGGNVFHGDKGPLHVSDQHWPSEPSRAFVEAATQLQYPETDDFNGGRQEGFGLYQVTQHQGERWSAARAFLDPLKGKANLDVRTDTMVERIIIENGRATGVVVRRGGQQQTLKAKQAIVVSGGAFGSPQTLMLSGIGPAEHLKAMGIDAVLDKAAVGADLQDHCDHIVAYDANSPDLLGGSLASMWRMLKALVEYRRHKSGLMTTPFAESGGFAKIRPDAPAPDVQYHFIRGIVQNHGRDKVRETGFSVHACVLRPKSRGTVRLKSKDPVAAPAINPNFLSDPDGEDIALLRDATRLMARICDTEPLKKYIVRDRHPVDYADDNALDALIRARADTIYHPVGTCRMGADASDVVDPELRVRGIDGLYVADASIMPRLISGNTNAPSIMIGMRCADFVKRHLKA